MQFSTISTFTDWGSVAGCWGRPGVYRIFDYMKMSGIKDIYWRVFNGGYAMYPSKVAQVQDREGYDEWIRQRAYPQDTMSSVYLRECDFNRYDALPDAVEAANEFGINLHLWYSLFEDDHGGPFLCRFAKDHPEYWQTARDGSTYRGTLDFFFEEVRAYKLAIVDELLQYSTAGLMLDFARHNACPSSDAHGIHRFGYNPEIRAAFRDEDGRDPNDIPPADPAWLAFKQAYHTSLIAEIRRRMDATDACRELSMMIWPVDYATWACIDIQELTGQGMIQMLNAFSLKYTYNPRELLDEYAIMKAQVRDDDCRLLPGVMAYNGMYGADLDDCVRVAEENGIEELMLFEADALVKFNLLTTVRAANRGVPNYSRRLTATPVTADAEGEIDWSAVPERTEFLFNSGPKRDPVPSEKTAVQIAYTDEDLLFRFTCSDSHMDEALLPEPEDPHHRFYLDQLGPRTHFIYTFGVNVFIDPTHGHQDFFHFYLSPRDERMQETMVDETWAGEWSSEVETDDRKWTAVIRVPFASLGLPKPVPGEEWGINLLRGIRHAQETSCWFYVRWTQPYPDDMGHLVFGA